MTVMGDGAATFAATLTFFAAAFNIVRALVGHGARSETAYRKSLAQARPVWKPVATQSVECEYGS